jgi:hypothetical protein
LSEIFLSVIHLTLCVFPVSFLPVNCANAVPRPGAASGVHVPGGFEAMKFAILAGILAIPMVCLVSIVRDRFERCNRHLLKNFNFHKVKTLERESR